MITILSEVETRQGNRGVVYRIDDDLIYAVTDDGGRLARKESELTQIGTMPYSERVDILEKWGLMPQGLR